MCYFHKQKLSYVLPIRNHSHISTKIQSVVRRAIFKHGQERTLNLTDSRGSKGALWRPSKTTERSQEGKGTALEGLTSWQLWGTWWSGHVSLRTDRPLHHDVPLCRPHTLLRWRGTAVLPTSSAGRKAPTQWCISVGLSLGKNTNLWTDATSKHTASS